MRQDTRDGEQQPKAREADRQSVVRMIQMTSTAHLQRRVTTESCTSDRISDFS